MMVDDDSSGSDTSSTMTSDQQEEPVVLDVNALRTSSPGAPSFEAETPQLYLHDGEAEGGGDVRQSATRTMQEETSKEEQEEEEQCFVRLHLLKEAIELNQEGVCLLQSGGGYEEQAIAIFRRSLKCVKTNFAAATTKAAASSSPPRHPTTPPRSSSCTCSRRNDQYNNLDDEEKQAIRGGNPSQALAQSPFHVVCSLPERTTGGGPRGGAACSCTSCSQPHQHHRTIGGLHHHHHPMIVPVQVLEPNSLDNNFYVFTKAFVFETWCVVGNKNQGGEPGHHHPHAPQLLGCCLSYVDHSELLSAMIIYNIGLGLHIKAMRINCSTLQQRSRALYEMSMGLLCRILKGNDNDHPYDNNKSDYDWVLNNLKKDGIPHGSTISTTITSLLIACCNNVGHLSYYLQDDYERLCQMIMNLQFLLKLLWTNKLQTERPESSSSFLTSHRPSRTSHLMLLEHHDIQGLTWNVMFLYPAPYAPAA